MPEIWRTIGFATFAALFGYLAARPQAIGLWGTVLANKVALTVAALVVGRRPGADESAAWDGALVVILGIGLALVIATRTFSPSANAARPR